MPQTTIASVDLGNAEAWAPPNSPEAIAFAAGQNEMHHADRVALAIALGARPDTPWKDAIDRVRELAAAMDVPGSPP